MIRAKHSLIGDFFWKSFSRISIKLCFHKVAYDTAFEVEKERSVLLIGNHISWWDGFVPLYLCGKLFHKRFHVMMLEKELSKRRFMRQGGAFSIAPGSRDMIHSLQYSADLLKDPGNLVLIYPQGKITSIYTEKIHFQPGIKRIIEKAQDHAQVIFFSALPDYFSNPRPTLFYNFQKINSPASIDDWEATYQAFYLEHFRAQQTKTS